MMYADSVYKWMRETEVHFMPCVTSIQNQTDINPKMRQILVDWLIDLHAKLKMKPDTLFICINLVDRILTMHQIDRKSLQLVGVTAIFIASKYQEI